jgi:hypothetical protein
MTISPRAARAVRKLREQMRDLAAAEHGAAMSTTAAAAAVVAQEQTLLVQTQVGAAAELARANSVYALDQVSDHIAAQRCAVVDAQASHAATVPLTDLAAARLRARIRQLKTAERVVELIDEERAQTAAKAEQRAADDLNAARFR